MKNISKYIFWVLVFLLIVAGFKLSESQFFDVTTVNISGDNDMVKSDILEKLNQYKGSPIVYVDTNKLETEILKDVRVKDVSISKVYPDTIDVMLNTRKAVGYIREDNGFYGIDENLNIFSKFSEIKDKDLPIVYFDEDSKDDISSILKQLIPSNMYALASEIKKENGIYTIILNDGVRVYLNEDITTDRLNKCYEVYLKESAINNISYIDLRYDLITVG